MVFMKTPELVGNPQAYVYVYTMPLSHLEQILEWIGRSKCAYTVHLPQSVYGYGTNQMCQKKQRPIHRIVERPFYRLVILPTRVFTYNINILCMLSPEMQMRDDRALWEGGSAFHALALRPRLTYYMRNRKGSIDLRNILKYQLSLTHNTSEHG